MERELRRQFTFARLTDLLADWIGREAVIDTLSALLRLSRLLSASVGFPLSREEYAGHVELRLFLFGCLEEAAQPLLWLLAKLEGDSGWKRDILAAASSWEAQFEAISGIHGSPRTSAGLAQDLSDVVADDDKLDADPAAEVVRTELFAESAARLSSPTIVGDLHDFLKRYVMALTAGADWRIAFPKVRKPITNWDHSWEWRASIFVREN